MKTVANIGFPYLVRHFLILKVSKIVLKNKNKFTSMRKWNTEWREKYTYFQQRPKWNREKHWGSRITHSFSETWGKKGASQVALVVKKSSWQCRRHKRHGFNPCIRKIPWRRAWQSTQVFLPGESHGQRSLAGYGP